MDSSSANWVATGLRALSRQLITTSSIAWIKPVRLQCRCQAAGIAAVAIPKERQDTEHDQGHHHHNQDRAPTPADRDQPDASQPHRQDEHAERAHPVGLDQGLAELAFRDATARRLNPPW
jgi:hypothetical protein